MADTTLEPFLAYVGRLPALLNQLGFWSKLSQRMGSPGWASLSATHTASTCQALAGSNLAGLVRGDDDHGCVCILVMVTKVMAMMKTMR